MTIEHIPVTTSPAEYGLAYEDVSFSSRGDGLLLKGWLLPAAGEQVITIVNGGYQNRIDENGTTMELAAALVAAGYNVLLFDLRGRGESEGTGYSLCNFEEDIGGAVDYLHSLGYAPDDVGIMGFCSGAALSCLFASQNDIGVLVLDGCFTRVSTMVVREAQGVGMPTFLTRIFLPGLNVATHIFYGFEVINPVDVVGDIECPIFFIHEEYDPFITLGETYELYHASGNGANEIWEVLGSDHSQPLLTRPEEYIEKVTGFLARAFGEASG